MKKALSGAWLIVLLAGLSTPTNAGIIVGTHELLPNTPAQQIEIFVTGGDAVDGINFNIQIEDGTGATPSPPFTRLDILTGTIFAGKNTGSWDNNVLPQIAWDWTETSPGETVLADGLLGTLTVDTTGYDTGSWALRMSDTLNGPTDFAGLAADITDGRITITDVPEPSTMALCLALCGSSLLLHSRGRRGRSAK